MAIRASSELQEMFERVRKNMRLWETWKLKCNDFQSGTPWDRMSKHDQDFNLAYNELRGLLRDASLPKLRRMLEIAKQK